MKLTLNIFILVLLVLSSSCKNDKIVPKAKVSIHFFHKVEGSSLEMDTLKYTNAIGQKYSIKTVKYFISRVTFHRANMEDIIESDIHFVNIRDTTTLTFTLTNEIPIGDYTGISFVYGLIPEDNITGSLGIDLDRLMEWPVPMGGGYHYMKLEGEYVFNNITNFFNFHSGGLNGTPYEVHIDLPNSAFSASSNTENIGFSMNIANWFQTPVNWDFDYWGSGIMGNTDAQATVQKNGVDVFTFVNIDN